MNALIIYSAQGSLADIAEGLKTGLTQSGFKVEMRQAESSGSTPLVVSKYDLVCVGSPVLGTFGGQVAADIDGTIKRISRLEGKVTVAFVKPKLFGSRKSLTRLMGMLEHQGAWVQDFSQLKDRASAENFGLSLDRVVRNTP